MRVPDEAPPPFHSYNPLRLFMSPPFTLVLSTRNPGKVEELRARLEDLDVALVTLADIDDAPEVDEDAETLAGNAAKKATALYQHTRKATLADDTGLEVEALNGAPGVHSARFAGEDATDADNRSYLLEALSFRENRSARFRTVLAYVSDRGALTSFEGVCEGHLVEEERGANGFGYDSIFVPAKGDGRTFAEMTADEKARISHRGEALEAFVEWFSQQ